MTDLPDPSAVMKHAYEDWMSFTQGLGEDYKAESLFRLDRPYGLNMFAVAFLRHCVQKRLGTGMECPVMFSKLSEENQDRSKRPASWLHTDQEGHPLVVIDEKFVRAMVPIASYDRTITNLILHEAGHIAEHWPYLSQGQHTSGPSPTQVPSTTARSDGQSPTQVRSSTAEQEREAWWYAGAVLGLALGDVGFSGRQAEHFDEAWLYS